MGERVTGEHEWTIAEMISEDPEVGVILRDAAKFRKECIPDWHDYSRFRGWLCDHVGWGARCHRLQSSKCYEIALRQLVDNLGL